MLRIEVLELGHTWESSGDLKKIYIYTDACILPTESDVIVSRVPSDVIFFKPSR